jgi:hypothetical protein
MKCPSKKTFYFLLFMIPMALPAADGAAETDRLTITHVTVIDCTGTEAKPNSTVVITDGRIAAERSPSLTPSALFHYNPA